MAKFKNIKQEDKEEVSWIIFTESSIAHLRVLHQNSDEETKRKIEKILLKSNIILDNSTWYKVEENENLENTKNNESIETQILNSKDMAETINLIYNLVLENYDKDEILKLATIKEIESTNLELNAKIIKIEEYINSSESI